MVALTIKTMSSLEQEFDNYSFDLDFDDTSNFSWSDEDDGNIKAYSSFITSPTNLIEETESLLRKRSSSLTLDDHFEKSNVVSSSSSQIPRNSILGTKHIVDALPVVSKMKPKKSVRFDMGLNVVSEIQQPELSRYDSVDSNDSFENVLNNNKNNNKSERHEKTDNDKVASKNVEQPTTQILTDIDKLKKDKETLIKDIEDLKNQHEKEMKQLRTEYQQRRESYYDELDQVRNEVDQKRDGNLNVTDTENIDDKEKERRDKYNEEKKSIDELEKSLEQRREQAIQQEIELNEYESYLERRHRSLTQKEEDLCMLQDELEQLAVALQDREKELTEIKDSLSCQSKENICEHDNDEIARTRDAYVNLQQVEKNLQQELNENNDKLQKKKDEIRVFEEEIKRLNSKNKLLESQLAVNRKHSPSHIEKRTTLSLISRNSKENLASSPAKKSFKDTNNNSIIKSSPQRSAMKYSSPSSTTSSSDTSNSSSDVGYSDELENGERLSNDYLDGTVMSPITSPNVKKGGKIKNDEPSKSVISRTCSVM